MTMDLNVPLLNRLRAAAGAPVPLDVLGADVEGVGRDLEALIAFGFAIEQRPFQGAAYLGPAERLCPDQIEHGLDARRIGRRIAVWDRIGSTNDLAARAGRSPTNDGLVVLAEEQTAGRGRRGRSWSAPPRSSILMSVLLFPPPDVAPNVPEAAFGCAWLTALGAIATAEVVELWTGRAATIKWPNDVRARRRKIAGVLVERAAPVRPARAQAKALPTPALRSGGVVIGIGLNANLLAEDFPPKIREFSTSLRLERAGAIVDRSDIVRDLVRRLDHWYDAVRIAGCEALNAPWKARCEPLGRLVRVTTPAGPRFGRLVDLDARHGLVLQRDEPDETPARSGSAFAQNLDLARVPLANVLDLREVEDDHADASMGI